MSFSSLKSLTFRSAMALACAASAGAWAQFPEENSAQDNPALMAPEGVFPLDELRLFTQVMEQVRRSYVERVDDSALFENAVRGLLNELDPHSSYLDSKALTELHDATAGEFGGLGIEVSLEGDALKVVTPLDDSPAARADVRAGDLIIKINNTVVNGLTLDRATDLLRGEIGEPVTLTLLSVGSNKPRQITLIREIVKLRSVKTLSLPQGVTYLRLSQFQFNTADEVRRALQSGQQTQPNNALIIDLRNNPGGVLQAAVDVADLFLHEGLIVYTRGRLPDSNMRYQARANNEVGDMPLVVLINEGSASAAEILAGALQDQRRAKILGQQSFGKGSVQTVMPIGEDKAIKLTTALYYTPSGHSIQAHGITPDVIVDDRRERDQRGEIDSVSINEASLNRHLPGANEKQQKGKHKAIVESKMTALDMQTLLADPYIQAAYQALGLR